MNSKYFYLDIDLCGREETALSVRRQVQAAATSLFGECGGAALGADVLSVSPRCVLRVRARDARRLRAALGLAGGLRVAAQAASLQALV